MAIIPAIMAGVSIIEGITNAKSARDRANKNISMIDQQLELIVENKKALEEAFKSQRGYVTDKYGNSMQSLNQKIGLGFEGVNNEYQGAVSKSDLAYSGSIEKNYDMAQRDLSGRYQDSATGLRDNLQGTMLDLTTREQTQMNELHSQWRQLMGQRGAYGQQSKTKFLGIF